MSFLSIDLETRSIVDLRKTGVYPYAEHPTTDVWCMSYAVPGAEPKTWFPGDPVPRIIPEVLKRGLPFRAWNAGFEHIIWREILVKKHGFPKIPMDTWVDTAAEAAALALPRGLGAAALVLGMEHQKDVERRKLMKKMCRPRAYGAWWIHFDDVKRGPFATKADANTHRKEQGWKPREVELKKDERSLVWWDDEEDIARLAEYCEDDVRAEMGIALLLPDLSPVEREVYLLNQRMNDRGVLVDTALVEAASDLNDVAQEEAAEELAAITDGVVTKVTQATAIREWVNAHSDLDLPDLRKDTVRDTLNHEVMQHVSEDVARVLQIRQDCGKTSTSKLDAFLRCTADDGRAHGLLLYHGASTGRWAGRLVQPQNFPRPEFKDPERLIPAILARDVDALRAEPHSIPSIFASMLRSMLRAAPGYEFFAADFSQIEARVLAWLAGQEDLVKLFAEGGKIYETMAAFIFGMNVDDIDKDSFERQIGKNSALGAGFQMGPDRFAEQVQEQTGIVLDRGTEERHVCPVCLKKKVLTVWTARNTCAHCGLTTRKGPLRQVQVREDVAQKAISGYRSLNYMIPQFWKDIEQAAIQAVQNPGKVFSCGVGAKIKYTFRGQFLWCRLPSGRKLAYAKPQIVNKRLPEPYEDVVKPALMFRGINTYTRKWGRCYSYGGHLTENVVQAIARDLMAAAMLRVDRAGYNLVLTVHDEVVTEEPEGEKDFDEFMELIRRVPRWAAGLPVAAGGWTGERYCK